jgi:hypothetical protein
VASGSYELPFGTGKAISFGGGKWTNRLLGGWVINSIYSFEVGAPLTWGDVIYLGGDLQFDPRNVNDRAFSPAPFVTASNQQRAFDIRTFPSRFANLRANSTNNLDASLLKNTHFAERLNFQLRFEAFNALNHVRFGGPNLSPTSSSFGRITGQDNLPRSVQLGARLVW